MYLFFYKTPKVQKEPKFILWVLFLYRFGAERFPYSLFRGPLGYPCI